MKTVNITFSGVISSPNLQRYVVGRGKELIRF